MYSLKKGKWSGEYDSRDEAVAAAQAKGLRVFFVGQVVGPYYPRLSSDFLIGKLRQVACRDCGLISRGWLKGVSLEQAVELERSVNGVIVDWFLIHGLEPGFEVANIEKVEVLGPRLRAFYRFGQKKGGR